MSHRATNWAVEQRGLKPATKIVLWQLADRHNPDHGCFPSQKQLAHDCEMSRSSVNTHLAILEERGLIRRIQARNDRTFQQENTRYLLAFEDGFEPVSCNAQSGGIPPKPCPETGHGNTGDPVSNSGPIPCPENRDSRVQNLDTNPVREPVREPVIERERAGAGNGEDAEDRSEPLAVSRETWKRRLKRAHGLWPTHTVDSSATAEKAWFALDPDERLEAADRQADYVAISRRLGRTKICAYAVYLSEKRWLKLPRKAATDPAAGRSAPPFGKLWGVVRFADLMRPAYGPAPHFTKTEERLIEAGSADRDVLTRQKRARDGWPAVTDMQERAVRHRKGVSVPAELVPLGELFGRVRVGSELWAAWQRLHEETGWPWFGPDGQLPDWVYMPAVADGPWPPDDLVRGALAVFETEWRAIMEREAAE
ncbi:MAG: helix-turn-helix domain-containing protein [Roseibium sp.]|nr:helix-turn-helix domain-containing protein [Roseibium sp.]